MAFNQKKRKTMSGFLKIHDFFLKSVLRKTAEFSISDTGDPLILTCLDNMNWGQHVSEISSKATKTLDFLRRNLSFAPMSTKLPTKLW